MNKLILKYVIPVVVIFGMLMAACEPTVAPEQTTEAVTGAVDPTDQHVIFWHVWGTGSVNEAMLGIVTDFNRTNQWHIWVDPVDQGKYSNLEDAFNAAVQTGDLPDLVTGYTNAMANWFAVDALADLTPLVNDPVYGLSAADWAAFYPGAINGGKAPDGTFFAFPISQSENVLFYNSQWAKELGFAKAPTNYTEFKAQSCAAMEANNNDSNPDNDGTGGFVVNTGASNVASFAFANGGTLLSQDSKAYNFTDQSVVDVAELWKDMWDSGCAFATESYPNPEFASRKALFTMSSTAGLPYQIAAFNAAGAVKDQWTLVPFPGKNGSQAVNLYGQYVAIGKTNPERMLATWLFLKYMTSPEVQAKWIKASAYYPTRSDTLPLLDAYGKSNALWSYGLSFLQYGKAEPAWPSWTSVRRSVGDTFSAILQGTLADIPAQLQALNQKAAQAVIETLK
jgi:multiple sugar transport system substrate-binding protein